MISVLILILIITFQFKINKLGNKKIIINKSDTNCHQQLSPRVLELRQPQSQTLTPDSFFL